MLCFIRLHGPVSESSFLGYWSHYVSKLPSETTRPPDSQTKLTQVSTSPAILISNVFPVLVFMEMHGLVMHEVIHQQCEVPIRLHQLGNWAHEIIR